MPDSSDRPLTLEESLKEIETLDLPPERKALLQAELHLLAGEAKALEILQGHFLNNSEIPGKSDFDELMKVISPDGSGETQAANLRPVLATASLSFCGECTPVGGGKGRWVYVTPWTKVCNPCI
jgi:hypothetical protein